MLRNCIHKLSDNYSNIDNYHDLYQKTEKYKYISFDIFDTLIKRDVPNPVDIFNIIGNEVGIIDFKEKRINAEKKAREYKDTPEITLDDIYNNLSYIRDYKKIEKLECKVELEECVANKDIFDFFKYCVANKKVFIITDMYLPRDIIECILRENGFVGYDSLYISNEEQLVKSDGQLFKRALRKENISNKQIVHIGNSLRADYLGARQEKVSAIKVPTLNKRVQKNYKYMFPKESKYKYLTTFINNHINPASNYYDFGYQSFGPLLYGFITWLRNDLKKNDFKHVLFLARDGYIMKKVYDQMNCDDSIESEYFEASRRSLRVPTYDKSMDYHDMLKVLTVPNLTNPSQILDSWGLNQENYENQLLDLGFKLDSSIKRDSLESDTKFKKFFEDIKDDIFDNSAKELESLEMYLSRFNFSEKTAIVDIGWGGSMQRFLTDTLNKMNVKNNIHGYYVGLTKKSLDNLKKNGLKAKGYAFDAMNKDDPDMERPFVGLFETLFLEQAGSVKKYTIQNDSVSVERYPYEYIENGKKRKEIGYVKEIQKGALDFNRDFYKTYTARFLGFNRQIMFSNLYQVGVDPTLSDISLFGDFEFFNNGTKVYLANPKSMLFYSMNISSLRKDLYDSQWKIGFLKKVLKLKFDYRLIFNFLRKVTN